MTATQTDDTELWTMDDLARVLRRPRNTLRNDRSRRPETLPPAIKTPGRREPLWRPADVREWLASHLEKR